VVVAAAVAEWSDFFVAQVGASAVLAGLVFVGASINIDQVMTYARLPGRALEAMTLLILVLVVGSLFLIPSQSLRVLGVEVLLAAVAFWAIVTRVQLDVYRKTEHQYRRTLAAQIGVGQAAIAAFVVTGVVLLASGENGVYWTVPGILLCYLTAVTDAWVLLIEIRR